MLFDTRFANTGPTFQLIFEFSLDKRPVLQVISRLKYSLSLAVTSVFLFDIFAIDVVNSQSKFSSR